MRSTSLLAGAFVAGLTLMPGAAQAQGADACFIRGATAAEAAARPSPLKTTAVTMGGQTATLCYNAPSAKGRTMLGGLDPMGEPWRLGANEATAIHLPFDAMIGDVAVDAGSYSLYAIPGDDEFEFVVNNSVERWGIPITPEVRAEDVGSFTRPVTATDDFVETMTFTWESHGENMGHLVFEFENRRVEIPVHMGGMNHD